MTSLLQVRKRLSGELDLELLRAFSRAPSPVCQEFSSVFTCVVFLSIFSLSPRLGLCMVLFSARASTERLFLANTLTHLNVRNPALSPSLSTNAFVYIGGDRLLPGLSSRNERAVFTCKLLLCLGHQQLVSLFSKFPSSNPQQSLCAIESYFHGYSIA